MKTIMIKGLVHRTATLGLMLAMFATYSMVIFATSTKPVGELIVTGNPLTEGAAVKVNGEAATSGRTIFSSSTITTPDGMTASLNLGKNGKVELAPNTTFTLSADTNSIAGDLTAGSVTALNTALSVKTAAGDVVKLNSGETANAASAGAVKRQAGKGPAGLDWWIWGAIFASAITVIVVAAVVNNDNNNNNNPSVSPIR